MPNGIQTLANVIHAGTKGSQDILAVAGYIQSTGNSVNNLR